MVQLITMIWFLRMTEGLSFTEKWESTFSVM